ncbi:MAG: hypothetical protein IKY94_02720, partial [Lachnospiraceae bacterium]|nr:hypothetical protein [Lachnospiraceae bacterium]
YHFFSLVAVINNMIAVIFFAGSFYSLQAYLNASERYTLKLFSNLKNLITVNLTRGTMEAVIL